MKQYYINCEKNSESKRLKPLVLQQLLITFKTIPTKILTYSRISEHLNQYSK